MAVKVLVVGAGSIGRRHHDNLLQLGAEPVLRGWRGYGAAGFAAEIAGFDAAVIATATDVRLELIARAAAATSALASPLPPASTLVGQIATTPVTRPGSPEHSYT